VGLLSVSLLVIAGVWLAWQMWLDPSANPINRENFLLIHRGMTRAEVEEIFGGPPGDHTDRSGLPTAGAPTQGQSGKAIWFGDSYFILVRFNKKGRVLQTADGWASRYDDAVFDRQ
jgi:hypothetical protein